MRLEMLGGGLRHRTKESRCIQRDSGEEPRAVLADGHIRIWSIL